MSGWVVTHQYQDTPPKIILHHEGDVYDVLRRCSTSTAIPISAWAACEMASLA